MNKFQKELLEKCKEVRIDEKVPLLEGIYILPTTKKHDSGYKIMNIVGYTEDEYYLLDDMCDVVDLGDVIQKCIRDIHIDIHDNGIIHLWSNHQRFRSVYRISSCTFDVVDRIRE